MRNFLILLLFFPALVNSQTLDFGRGWEFAGPDDKPVSPDNMSASGIGPAEFVRVFKEDSKFLLAGSLSGGLFFSEDSGENWINSGSDSWDYSGCGWADFYPEDSKTWFAFSNNADNNGKPGKMGAQGGILRTKNAGVTWELIANGTNQWGTNSIAVYGLRFLPSNPKVLFILSEEGLFYSEDCMADKVIWKKYSGFGGTIYDMDFIGDTAFVSALQNGKWNVHKFNFTNLSHETIDAVAALKDDKRSITFEPVNENLLVLIDYSKLNDELWEFNIAENTFNKLLSGQQVNFGSGHTFAVNPHNQAEFILGNSTYLRKWSYPAIRDLKIGSGYHVDVEFVAYDPADSNKIWIACHGGIYLSQDKGSTWQSKSKGLGIAEVMGIDVSESDAGEVVIGCFHDGSTVLADFNKDGNYFWRTVNGGDALTPLIDPSDAGVVYTSTQFTGGGLYYSTDTSKSLSNLHATNAITTPGWELAAVLHPVHEKWLYFNYMRNDEDNANNMDIVRTKNASQKKSAEPISDFGKKFGLTSYKVYGLYNSTAFPDHLYAYVLHYDKNEDGKAITNHRLFKTEIAGDSASKIVESWYELELPVNAWLGDVQPDRTNPDAIFVSYASAGVDSENGMIYALKYNKKTKGMKKSFNISRNIPNSVGGRFNMVFTEASELFIATRTGVYYGTKKTLKGKADWQKVGYGLPHCKVYGLHYHEQEKILTVGLFGRGVWRYRF